MPLKAKKVKKPVTCARCDQSFKNWDALKRHSRTHLKTLDELKQLQQGKMPDESKLGAGFKGKNKIIVS